MNIEGLDSIGLPEDRLYREAIFARHPNVDHYLKRTYIRTARAEGKVAANRELSRLGDRFSWGAFSASMDDDDIKSMAKAQAKKCELYFQERAPVADLAEVSEGVQSLVEGQGLEYPLVIRKSDSAEQIRQKMLNAIARAGCAKWWRRQLRTQMGRKVEAELRALGYVKKQSAPYVSNWAFERWRIMQGRNRGILAELEAVNEEGEAVDLLDCVESSISNPVNRRNELMVRMRGYEEVSQGLGLVGLFFTLTTPSRFHAQLSSGGRNPKYEGASPRDAMAWLNDTWALIRSAWQKAGIRAFGFRVSEPHHDGTPHCHFLLFVNPAERERACDVFGHYALMESPCEPGAQQYRWDVKAIDPGKGSAAGYLAKYVAKNIDGFAVGTDEEGEVLAGEGAARVRAWASVWGIRQFQPVGSVSVTVWRELRRVTGPLESVDSEQVEALRSAADRGDWAEFVELMGGAFVKRSEQTLRPVYFENEAQPSRYGEAVKRLIGVWLQPVGRALGRCIVPTREHVWEIRARAMARDQVAAKPPPLDLCQ